ncbi:hypothetical protein COLO4_22136 [Corchorus olitorius]|uniref:Uncharacterized protein n=1 Tax=Corchorus olitorius TaxID=93759 RepID=A0A1R3INU0_9ROSI|nr:hypothetical protein COLO4_22136 [Corchorus olitorius]
MKTSEREAALSIGTTRQKPRWSLAKTAKATPLSRTWGQVSFTSWLCLAPNAS